MRVQLALKVIVLVALWLFHFLPLWPPLLSSLSHSPLAPCRILVFSSAVAKHRLSGDSSGLDLNLIILETSPKSRAR